MPTFNPTLSASLQPISSLSPPYPSQRSLRPFRSAVLLAILLSYQRFKISIIHLNSRPCSLSLKETFALNTNKFGRNTMPCLTLLRLESPLSSPLNTIIENHSNPRRVIRVILLTLISGNSWRGGKQIQKTYYTKPCCRCRGASD